MLEISDRPMGKVTVTLSVRNRADEIRASDGTISPDRIRSITLREVLVDTGATTLSLPASMIEQLGLQLAKEVDVSTAMGIGKARIFQDAKISVCGREGTFECLELPGGANPLLGVIPLEMLGLAIDLQKQELTVLPNQGPDTYLMIY